MKTQMIETDRLFPYPHNREFRRDGEEWVDFVESVRRHGVIEPLRVRAHPEKEGDFQILSGHRRAAAAAEAGIEDIECKVEVMDDREAMLFLINSNLQRENPNLIQEGLMLRELAALGMEDEEILEAVSRDIEWLEARQAVFSFDYCVIAAVKEGKLSEGALREVLRAPHPLREKAMDVVLTGGGRSDEPLSAERAREFIQFSLIPEWEKQMEWEAGMEKVRQAVLREMRKLCKGAADEPTVLVLPWGKGAEGLGGDLVPAKDTVPDEMLREGAETGRAWAFYAASIGAPVYVLPPDATHMEKRAMVSRKILLDDAAARLEHGTPGDLLAKARPPKNEAVERAIGALEGEREDGDGEEPTCPVATPGALEGIKIEQRMEHYAMIDFGAVRRLKEWANATDSDPMNAPEWLPKWAKQMSIEGLWQEIDQVCNWVMSLKGGAE